MIFGNVVKITDETRDVYPALIEKKDFVSEGKLYIILNKD